MKPRQDSSICSFVSSKGARCERVATNSKSGLCFLHQRIRAKHDADAVAKITDELLSDSRDLKSAGELQVVLANLFEMISKDTIPLKKGSLLAYIGVTLLHSYTNSEAEQAHAQGKQPPKFIWGWDSAFAPNSSGEADSGNQPSGDEAGLEPAVER